MIDESIINNSIYFSMYVEPMDKIIKDIKNYEFRNYVPKKEFEYIFLYLTAPIKELKYILKIGSIIDKDTKIKSEGDGNLEFNKGRKTKFAYEILKVYELEKPIPLKELKEKYKFMPPQAFAYGDRYKKLSNDIIKQDRTLIINNE